jgi:hypothetical protein
MQDARRPFDMEDGPLSPSSHSAADSASPSPHSAADSASPWQSGWGALYSPQVCRENAYDVFLHFENEYGFETAIDPVPPSAQRALRSHPRDEATLKPQRRRSKSASFAPNPSEQMSNARAFNDPSCIGRALPDVPVEDFNDHDYIDVEDPPTTTFTPTKQSEAVHSPGTGGIYEAVLTHVQTTIPPGPVPDVVRSSKPLLERRNTDWFGRLKKQANKLAKPFKELKLDPPGSPPPDPAPTAAGYPPGPVSPVIRSPAQAAGTGRIVVDPSIQRGTIEHLIAVSGFMDGSYAIRVSRTHPDSFVLCVCANKEVLHYPLERRKPPGHGFLLLCQSEKLCFDSLEEIVDHYSKRRGGLPVRLTKRIA